MPKEMSYNQSQPWPKFLRRWGSISLFPSHSCHCLQVSLWNFCIWSNKWWATVPCTQGAHSEWSAHTADLGVQFLCFWVTLGIASRSPFGIFAIGEATDELQVCARSNRWARARTDMLEGRFFQHLIGTWISLNIFGGLRLKKNWFEHSFASYRAVHVVGASVLAGA